MTPPEGPKTERVRCNACAHDTKHVVVAARTTQGSELVEGRYQIDWRDTYTMLQCLGCEAVCLRQESWFSEEPDQDTVRFYPPRVSRPQPRWTGELPFALQELLYEVYAALHADSRRLAMMGARAIGDLVLQDKVGDIGGFEQRLDALVEAGYVSKRNRAVLAAALDAGHAAAHRGHVASAEEANHVMDIVENLVQTDVLTSAAKKLASKTPPRPGQKPAAPNPSDGPANSPGA